MPEVHVNGARIRYEVRGDGPETILFAHGLLFSGEMFAPQVASLRPEYRCVTFDFRGQGRSETTRSGYDMDTLTVDAAGLIEALDLDPCHFCGLSMGGFVGMRLAIRHPDLIRSLMLLETSADPEPAGNVPRYRVMQWVARWFGPGLVLDRLAPIMFGAKLLGDPDRAGELSTYKKMLAEGDRVGMARAAGGVIRRAGVHAELGRIRCPTLILVGDQDVATPPKVAERIRDGIPGSRLVLIPGAGHSSTLEEPEAVTAAIRGFLAGISAEPVDRS